MDKVAWLCDGCDGSGFSMSGLVCDPCLGRGIRRSWGKEAAGWRPVHRDIRWVDVCEVCGARAFGLGRTCTGSRAFHAKQQTATELAGQGYTQVGTLYWVRAQTEAKAEGARVDICREATATVQVHVDELVDLRDFTHENIDIERRAVKLVMEQQLPLWKARILAEDSTEKRRQTLLAGGYGISHQTSGSEYALPFPNMDGLRWLGWAWANKRATRFPETEYGALYISMLASGLFNELRESRA